MNLEPSLKIRSVAATLIGDALRKKQSFELAFSRNQNVLAMDNRDRAFVHNLTLTTLRRLGQIDQLIDSCLKHPLPRSAQRVRDLLRIGVCQVLFLNIANHGAVSTCVELARQEGYASHVKLVNAVLRRLVREGELSQSLDNICLNTNYILD